MCEVKLNNGQFIIHDPNLDFECEWCGEEYNNTLAYYIVIKDPRAVNVDEKGICCPDCIGNFFIEDPESINSLSATKVIQYQGGEE